MKWFDDFVLNLAIRINDKRMMSGMDHRKEERAMNKILAAGQLVGQSMSKSTLSGPSSPRADFHRDTSMSFVLHRAEGGHILEINNYDQNHDRYIQRLHIITDDVNMGEAISKILTLESLRR